MKIKLALLAICTLTISSYITPAQQDTMMNQGNKMMKKDTVTKHGDTMMKKHGMGKTSSHSKRRHHKHKMNHMAHKKTA